MPTAVDIHFHAIPEPFIDAVRRGHLADIVEITPTDGIDRLLFHAPPEAAVEPGLAIRPRTYQAPLILQALDTLRLDMAAPSTPPEFFMYWAPPEAGIRIARLVNDGYAAWARAHPARLSPLAALPMQAPQAAATELRRAVGTLGLRGAAICTHVNGADLDHPSFAPVFAAAAELDVPLFLHPQNAGDISRLAPYHLWNTVGFPAETATAAARLIMSGALARHPDLKIVLAHGGGFLPYQLGRLDHAWRARPALHAACPAPPTSFLPQIWCDSLTHDPTALRFLLDRIGPGNVVLGTDHPFDMGDMDPLGSLDRAGLPAPERERVAAGNLATLLKL